MAELPIHHGLDPEQASILRQAQIPLPATRTKLPESGPVRDAALEVVLGQGLAWEDLRVKHLKDVFFSKGFRPALFFAGGLTHETGPDPLYPGRRLLKLLFELPRGAYATLVVKRVTDAATSPVTRRSRSPTLGNPTLRFRSTIEPRAHIRSTIGPS